MNEPTPDGTTTQVTKQWPVTVETVLDVEVLRLLDQHLEHYREVFKRLDT